MSRLNQESSSRIKEIEARFANRDYCYFDGEVSDIRYLLDEVKRCEIERIKKVMLLNVRIQELEAVREAAKDIEQDLPDIDYGVAAKYSSQVQRAMRLKKALAACEVEDEPAR